ncbi:uncharacterized protein [Macrobrachium rosenbergii]|uniref:uncharacterized protein n=1 Tax=Macrobrachium rosenbergii TaxID=79674 RepID=UPI0034D3F62F
MVVKLCLDGKIVNIVSAYAPQAGLKEVVKAKKDAKKIWEKYGQQEDQERYKRHKKQVKKAVTQEKARDMYEELGAPEGERKIHRIAKSRDKNTIDYSHIKQVKDENGVVLCNEDKIKTRRKEYYEHLLNEENPIKFFEDGFQNLGMTHTISRKEVKKALKKMKNCKAIRPDGIPADVWRSLGEEGIDMRWDLEKKIYSQEKIPRE